VIYLINSCGGEKLFSDVRWNSSPEAINFFKILSGAELSEEQAKVVRKSVTRYIDKTFKRGHRDPLYGRLSRALTKEQLFKFFNSMEEGQIKNAFIIQFFLGLRISEINLIEPNFNHGHVLIPNVKKKGKKEYLPLWQPFNIWLESIWPIPKRSRYTRLNMWKHYRKKAGLETDYGHQNGRTLYLYTSHSLRHTAITLVGDYLKDEYKTCMFSRHDPKTKLGTVSVYRNYTLDQQRDDLKKIFMPYAELFCPQLRLVKTIASLIKLRKV
jgi:integrase